MSRGWKRSVDIGEPAEYTLRTPPATHLVLLTPAARCFRAGRIKGGASLFNVYDLAIQIDHKRRPVRHSIILHQGAIGLSGRTHEITQQWKCCLQLNFGPVLQRGEVVSTDAEHLCVHPLKFSDTSLVRCHFLRSATGESGWEEGEHHHLLAAEIGQLHGVALSGLQTEVGRFVADL